MATLNVIGVSPELIAVVTSILMEVARAESKHPVWPDCHIKQIAFITEESGELTRAGNHIDEGIGTFKEVREEAIQTASTCIRFLLKLRDTEIAYYANPIEPVILDFLTDDDHESIRKEYGHE
jgi:hypothetical protein